MCLFEKATIRYFCTSLGGKAVITNQIIKELKQTRNIERDAEKVKIRMRDIITNSSKKDKDILEKLTGQKRTSFYRVAREGLITAKVAVAFAKVFNLSPYYLTGLVDEKGTCSDEVMIKFLNDCGYQTLDFMNERPKRKYTKRIKPEENTQSVSDESADASESALETNLEIISDLAKNKIIMRVKISNTPKTQEVAENLSFDEMTQLLQSLSIRAKTGGDAKNIINVVKYCLLS